jgi:hypothetical protein
MSAPDFSNDQRADDAPEFTRWPGLLSLSLCIMLGPMTVLLSQQVTYAANMWACGHGARGTLHIIPVLALVVIVGALFGSYLNWRAVGKGVEVEHGAVATRTRFLAVVGMAISVLSAILVVAQWFAIFMFDPCMRA